MTREEAIKILKSIKEEYDCPCDIEALDMAIEVLQTEQKVGRWIKRNNPDLGICMQELKMCSVCGRMFCARYNPYWSYCGNCGAKMEEGE